MNPNPLQFVQQDFDSAASMAVDRHNFNLSWGEDVSFNSCLNFICQDSIPRPAGPVTRNPNEEETPADMEFDENPGDFHVWDLNTSNPELENGTLTDKLKSILAQMKDCMLYDSLLSGCTENMSVGAFDLRDMKSALEEGNVDRLTEILDGLGISGQNSKV